MVRNFIPRPVHLEQAMPDDFQSEHQPTQTKREMERSAYDVFDYVGHVPAQISRFLKQVTDEVDLTRPRFSPSSGRPRMLLTHRTCPAKVKIQKIIKGEGSNISPYKLKRIVGLRFNVHSHDVSFWPGLVQSHRRPTSPTAKVKHALRNGHASPSFSSGVWAASTSGGNSKQRLQSVRGLWAVSCRQPRVGQPVQHEPCRLLSHTNLFRQLQRRDAFPSRHKQIHGIEPFVQGNVAALEDRASTDREIKLAWVAAVEAALARGDVLFGLAGRAGNAVRPDAGFQKKPSRFRVREHLEKLEGADCAFAHGLNVLDSRTFVKGINYIVPIYFGGCW